MARVGWLGLGAMGLPMARRLIGASHEVTAFDPVPGIAGGARRGWWTAGVRRLPKSPTAPSIVFVTVATPEQATAALFGAGGAAEALAPGATVVVMSTIGPVGRARAGRSARSGRRRHCSTRR